MSDDSDGEGFYDDHFEEASDGDDSCGDPFADEEDDDGCLGLCGGPSDEEDDDDSNGEGMCEVPCCYDDEDGSDHEEALSDDDDGESEEALSDDDDGESEEALSDDDDGEEVCDEEGDDGELVDDPCDEDEEEGDDEAQDLCEDPSCNDGEESELEVFCVSGFSVADGSHISDSVQDDSSSEEDDELVPIALPARTTPAPWPVRILLHTDSYDDIDSDSDDTDYDVDEYELHRLPASRAVVESLPEAIISEEEATCGCAVCKDVFPSGQRVIWLPCKHYFHGDCIRPWLAIRSTCPVCRYQLPTDDAVSRQARQLRVLVPVALPLVRHGEALQNTLRLTQPSEPNCCRVLLSLVCTVLYQWLITLPFGVAESEMEGTSVEPPQAQGMRGTE